VSTHTGYLNVSLPTLRSEAAGQGVNSTDDYLSWLESQVLDLRRYRDDLLQANNIELEKRRMAEARQPKPVPNDGRPVWELVEEDMRIRDQAGRFKYGVPLQAHNGRDAKLDLYQELLDAVVYCKQDLIEEETRRTRERRLWMAAKALLAVVGKYAPEEFPKPSHEGSCGPESGCDANCMTAAGMMGHNMVVERLERVIKEYD
jgi:hypothetical protein